MILQDKEKERLLQILSWMVEDLKHRYNESKGNFGQGTQGDYSPELKEAIALFEDVKKAETIGQIDFYRKLVFLNCRNFACVFNKQGTCVLSKITLESINSYFIGELRCIQAERAENPVG